jgi:hypothetical protein
MEQLTYGHTSLVAEQVALCPQASGLKFDPEACSEEMGRRNVEF